MICVDYNGSMVLVEAKYKLSNLFKHDHPFETFDYIICWSVDLELKTLADGNTLCLVKEGEEWLLKYGAKKTIPIIKLKTILNGLNGTNEISI